MSFMQPETTNEKFWEIESSCGETEFIPAEYADAGEVFSSLNNDGDTVTITVHQGKWFARLSASGYMDCTDWSGPFDTEEEALSELREMFGDEEEEEAA